MSILHNVGVVKGGQNRYAREVNPLANDQLLQAELTSEIKQLFGFALVTISRDETQNYGLYGDKVWNIQVRVAPDSYQNWTYEEI